MANIQLSAYIKEILSWLPTTIDDLDYSTTYVKMFFLLMTISWEKEAVKYPVTTWYESLGRVIVMLLQNALLIWIADDLMYLSRFGDVFVNVLAGIRRFGFAILANELFEWDIAKELCPTDDTWYGWASRACVNAMQVVAFILLCVRVEVVTANLAPLLPFLVHVAKFSLCFLGAILVAPYFNDQNFVSFML